MTRQIKVGFLVSYDYELIQNSLPPVVGYEAVPRTVYHNRLNLSG